MRDTSTSNGMRLGLRLALGVLTAAGSGPVANTAQAQTTEYTFTKIADTVEYPGLGGINCLGMNNLGTVIVKDGGQIWRGDGQTFTLVEDQALQPCPSINDADELAYAIQTLVSGVPVNLLVRNAGGTFTTLVTSSASPYFSSATTYLPSLSNTGSAVFQSQGQPAPGTGAGIYVAPSGPVVYNATTDGLLNAYSTASMNDSLIAVFRAQAADGTAGIYRGSATPLIQSGTTVGGETLGIDVSCRPVINNSGTVAFGGSTSGTQSVYTTSDGVSVDLVGTSNVGVGNLRISINDAGLVAYRKRMLAGSQQGSGIFLGRPGAPDQKVIGLGDELEGSVVTDAFIWEEALNNRGQVAFFVVFNDVYRAVYRADPVDTTPPAVTPPPPLTIDATEAGGATGNASSDLAAFLASGSASDETDPSPVRLTPQFNGGDATNDTLFPVGANTVTFRFEDASDNIGTAESTVTVTAVAPTCAADVTAGVTNSFGNERFDRRAGTYTQKVTLRGAAASPITGPLALVLDNLGAGVTLVGASGTTACAAPLGSPWIAVDPGSDGVLSNRERLTVELVFQVNEGATISYVPRILDGTGER